MELCLPLIKSKFEHLIHNQDFKTAVKMSLPKWTGDNLELKDCNIENEYFVHLCGKITDKTVLDFDSDEIFFKYLNMLKKQKINLDDVPIYKTSRGFQVFYRYIEGLKTTVAKDVDVPIDVRNDGSLSFAHPSLFKFNYYSDYNNISFSKRRPITQYELDTFLELTDTSMDSRYVKDNESKSINTQVNVKTSKSFLKLVNTSIENKTINEIDLLNELQSTRPFEFDRIPTHPGEGRNNFLTIFRGKVLRHTEINAKKGADFLELINDLFLNLPKSEMKNFSEKALLKSPLYIDPEKYKLSEIEKYSLDKYFYGMVTSAPYVESKWVRVTIKSEKELDIKYYLDKESFTAVVKRDDVSGEYYLNNKGNIDINKLKLIEMEDDYTTRKAYRSGSDGLIINKAASEYTDYYVNYDKYNRPYTKPTSFIKLLSNVIPDEKTRNYFLGSLHYFIKSGKTCQTYPILYDYCGGTGKTALTNIINKIIYTNKPVAEITSQELVDLRFNSHIVTQKLLVINESGGTLSKNDSKKLAEKMKTYIASDSITYEAKGKPAYTIKAPRFVIQTTNNIEDIHIDSNNHRRQYLVQTSGIPLRDLVANSDDIPFNSLTDFFKDLEERMDDIVSYIYDIGKDFTWDMYSTAIETQDTLDMASSTEADEVEDIKSLINNKGALDKDGFDFMMLEEGNTDKRQLLDYLRVADKEGILREIRLRRVLKEAYPYCGRTSIAKIMDHIKKNCKCLNPKATRHKIFKFRRE